MIIVDVLLTLVGVNATAQLIKVPGCSCTMLEKPSGTATSLPIVPENYDVVSAGDGFCTLLTHKFTVETMVSVENTDATVTILPDTEHVYVLVAPSLT